MQYHEIRPGAAVARFVRCYWILEDPSPDCAPQRIVPDGRSELILNLGRPYELETPHGWQIQARCFLVGQITRPLMTRPAGPARMVGIRFHPHVAAELLRVPIHELTNTSVPIADLSPDLLCELDRIGELPPAEWRLALDSVVSRLAGRTGTCDLRIAAAVAHFESAGGMVSVAAVAGRVGLSPRQFERRFHQAVGIPPKLFCRMRRFQRVFRAFEEAPAAWADAAIRCGYYDQAHLHRDFREFAGKSPSLLLAEGTDLARHFVEAGLSHFSNTATRRSC